MRSPLCDIKCWLVEYSSECFKSVKKDKEIRFMALKKVQCDLMDYVMGPLVSVGPVFAAPEKPATKSSTAALQ